MPFWMCNAAALSDSDEADCHSSVMSLFRGGAAYQSHLIRQRWTQQLYGEPSTVPAFL
jgi:hypothetical protein